MASKLVFGAPADGTARLVFGEASATTAQPTALSASATFATEATGLDARVQLHAPPSTHCAANATLATEATGLACTVQLLWSANVSRGEATETRTAWQAAQPQRALASAHWQPAQAVTARTASHWQAGAPTTTRAASHWQSSQRHTARTAAAWQAAQAQRHTAASHWQASAAQRASTALTWQSATAQRLLLLARYQSAQRLRHAALQAWQTTAAAQQQRHQLHHTSAAARPTRLALALHWQPAMRPSAGLSVVIQPQPPQPQPCDDPATLGRLEFTEAWASGARLVFVCNGAVQPRAAIVIPLRSIYMAHNNVTLHRLPSGAEFQASQFDLRLDADSFTMSWTASLHSSARQHLARATPGEPLELACEVNGTPLRLVVERIGRDRAFPQHRIQIGGRGLGVELANGEHTFGLTTARTAQQLMADVLMDNGVAMGWTLDWQITDWLVSAAAWVWQGTRIAAITDIASAAGAYIQPHPTQRVLRVLPRYPAAPWDWASSLVPDIELPVEATTLEGVNEVIKPAYNSVFVGGVRAPAVFGPVTRAGTAGDQLAPQVLHPLITAAQAHVQRARAVLCDTGVQEHLTLRTLILPESGIIWPGQAVRYVSDDGPRLGIVRATHVSMSRWPAMHQTMEVQTHVQ